MSRQLMAFATCRNLRGLAIALVVAGAPVLAGAQQVRAQTVAGGLEHPWAVAFLPEGRFLVTERPGRMRVVEPGGRLNEPLQGLPVVA
ncbi:MAG TPA: PQQ-dependent sugar dehydrogenase, partial [Ottowia sp.]|nr:PQQ-dependent sugar dehydrogenase [Ottowia sp.]